MARWSIMTQVRPGDWQQTQGGSSFDRAVDDVVHAHLEGLPWDARVKGPRDSAWRTLNETETARLINAASERIAGE